MKNNEIKSPPASVEKRLFNIPDRGKEDQIFTFNFNIERIDKKLNVTFTLDLNPTWSSQDIESPTNDSDKVVYTFGNNGECDLNHKTSEGYYVKGTIKIISFPVGVGQFDNNSKNFLFDLKFGKNNDTPYCMSGLFALINPES